ncbi:MAG: hypothetical protein CL674_17110 [Bdellovibrionaceae bacterium]|nr:hypothetical protein [Pseudobdellovibrionaceae bacterium]|tara:strand:+ start:1179 stop:2171 length:993 start_codon:yes stop_codon:yes gene_type:complete
MQVYNQLPENFVNTRAEDLHKILSGPSLFDLKNAEADAYVFLSVLLHGNEPTGLKVVQRLLKKYDHQLPFNVLLLVGNVQAAKDKVRYLSDQQDMNRIWNGGDSEMEKWASEVKDYVISKKPIWGLDLHNNTGKNPLYACVNHLHDELFLLAGAFSDKVVYFESPEEALSVSLSEHFPTVTLECGHFADLDGVERSFQYVENLLSKNEIKEIPYNPNFKLFEVEATVKVRPGLDIYIGDHSEEEAVCFLPHLENLNFEMAKEGSVLGRSREESSPLVIYGVEGEDLHDQYIEYIDGRLQLQADVVPSMISLDPVIIRQDCLGYFMKEKKI